MYQKWNKFCIIFYFCIFFFDILSETLNWKSQQKNKTSKNIQNLTYQIQKNRILQFKNTHIFSKFDILISNMIRLEEIQRKLKVTSSPISFHRFVCQYRFQNWLNLNIHDIMLYQYHWERFSLGYINMLWHACLSWVLFFHLFLLESILDFFAFWNLF